jgi:hypothetical protein
VLEGSLANFIEQTVRRANFKFTIIYIRTSAMLMIKIFIFICPTRQQEKDLKHDSTK